MTDKPIKPTFIYNTPGDWQATLLGQYIFDPRGECIGFVEGTSCYTLDGEWLGDLARDGRILRKRTAKKKPLHPNPPPKLKTKPAGLPSRAPLPGMTAELGYDTIDILDEDPQAFRRVSERKRDLGE